MSEPRIHPAPAAGGHTPTSPQEYSYGATAPASSAQGEPRDLSRGEPARLVPPRCSSRARGYSWWPAAFGRRFFLALLAGLVWIGPAWWNPRFAYAILVWDAVVIALWYLDWCRLPRPEELEIAREWLEPVALGAPCQVMLTVRGVAKAEVARASRPQSRPKPALSEAKGWPYHIIVLSLEDELPETLRAESSRVRFSLRSGSAQSATYVVKAQARGDAHLGRVFLRYHGPLEFAERRAVAELAQTVRVYPNLQEAKKLSLYLMRSRQIELEKRVTHRPERGREFESLREYRDGDEPRDICWTATARRARLVTKVYQAERSQAVMLVVDAGRLMLARSGPMAKLDYAITAALSLAHVAMAGGDSVGLLAYGRQIQAQLGAARGAAHLRTLLDSLALVRGELVEADHGRAAESLLRRQRRRSLVVWITDLAETAATPEVMESALRLLPRHLVLFVVLGQPDLERLLAKRPESLSEMYRYVAGSELAQRRVLLLRRLREQGALALEINPQQLALGLVSQYLQIKERSLL